MLKIYSFLLLFGICLNINAQDEGYSESAYPPDSTSMYGDYASDSSYNPEATEPSKPVKKPYVRFTVPFDTIKELVTYTGVIEEEEATIDSLYFRAKRWMIHEFGKNNKSMVIKKEDKKAYEIIKLECRIPLIVENNKFSKTQNGFLCFEMEIRFKDGKYKYKINNLVHKLPPPPGTKDEIITYFEFYRKSNINPKGNDQILISADKKINAMVKDLRKYCKEPIQVDEDDW